MQTKLMNAIEAYAQALGRVVQAEESGDSDEKIASLHEAKRQARDAVQAMLVAAAPQAVQAEVDLPDVEDMAHSVLQDALSFGLSHDVLHRWMSKVMRQTQEAIAATNPTQQGLDAQQLHSAIMNLPTGKHGSAMGMQYREGHRDARHAAAALVLAAQAKQGGV